MLLKFGILTSGFFGIKTKSQKFHSKATYVFNSNIFSILIQISEKTYPNSGEILLYLRIKVPVTDWGRIQDYFFTAGMAPYRLIIFDFSCLLINTGKAVKSVVIAMVENSNFFYKWFLFNQKSSFYICFKPEHVVSRFILAKATIWVTQIWLIKKVFIFVYHLRLIYAYNWAWFNDFQCWISGFCKLSTQ